MRPLLPLLLVVACIPLPGNREFATKRVVGIRGTDTLVADDDTICRLPTPQASHARAGQRVRCVWERDRSGATTWRLPSTGSAAASPIRR